MTVKTHKVDSDKNKITMTDNAIAHVEKALKKRGQGVGIRLSIETRGCSGLAYVVNYVDEADVAGAASESASDAGASGAATSESTDLVFPINENISVYVDRKSFTVVKGTRIDYVREGLNEHFTYENPNEKGSCGCGESFTIDDTL